MTPTPAPPFGEIITAGHVRAALKATLQQHLAPVLAVVAERSGYDPDQVPAPTGYGGGTVELGTVGLDKRLIVVRAAGMGRQPARRGDGRYEMAWDAAVGVVVAAKTSDAAEGLSEVYGAAVRAAVLQHRSLGGFAETTVWLDERHEEITASSGTSVWAASVVFEVTAICVVDGYATAGPNPFVQNHTIEVGRVSDQ